MEFVSSIRSIILLVRNMAFKIFSKGFLKICLILNLFTLIEMHALNQILLGSRESKKPVKSCRVPDFRGTLYSLQSTCSQQDHCSLEAGQEVPGSGTVVSIKCSDTYMLRQEQLDFVVCYDGSWYPKDHSCLKTCRARYYKTIKLTCYYNGDPVSCNTNSRIGTNVEWRCKPGFRTDNKRLHNHCLKNGKWQFTLPECTPENRTLSAKIELGSHRSASAFGVGKQIQFSCNVDGYPAPTNIKWFKDGQFIKSGGRITSNETTLGNYTISIQNATLSDSGTYLCKAENDHSSAENSTDIFVYYNQHPANHNHYLSQVGSNVSLSCDVSVSQLPISVRWSKSGQQILMGDKFIMTDLNCTTIICGEVPLCPVHSECTSQLIIREASLSDSDEYVCEVVGSEKIRKIMKVSVYVPQELSTEIKMTETTFPAGSDIEIPCEVDGMPWPDIRWYVNEDEFLSRRSNINTHKGYIIDRKQILFIYNAEVFHSGSYKCKAFRGDSVSESTVEITVTSTERCSLPAQRGHCSDYFIMYAFIRESNPNDCSKIAYSGCGGNLNRFNSRDMCQATCLPGANRRVCQLSRANTSVCSDYYPVWYYDAKLNFCQQFTEGQCVGNANWFKTKKDCQKLCVQPINNN